MLFSHSKERVNKRHYGTRRRLVHGVNIDLRTRQK